MVRRQKLAQGICEVAQLTAKTVYQNDRRSFANGEVVQATTLHIGEMPFGRHQLFGALAVPCGERSQPRGCGKCGDAATHNGREKPRH